MFVNDEAEAIMDAVLGGGTYTKHTTVYLGLILDIPDNDGDPSSFTEVDGDGYSRIAITNNDTNFPDCTPGTRIKYLATEQQFAAADEPWGTPTYHVLFDASTSGNVIAIAKIASPKSIGTGDEYKIPANKFKITAPGIEVFS